MSQFRIKFMPENRVIEADQGTSLLNAAAKAGIMIKSGCGGKGTCGACKVDVLSGDPLVNGTGNLTPEQLAKGIRLACKTLVQGDMTIEVPPESRLQEHQVLMGDVQKGLLQESEHDLLDKFGRHPLAIKQRISLSIPTLTENSSDWARLSIELRRVLKTGDKPIHMPLSILKHLPESLRKANWDVSITMTDTEAGLTITHIEQGNDVPLMGLLLI